MLKTQRTVLSIIARLFDPLGLLNPITIKAKKILNRLWREGLGWDDTLSPDLESQWQLCINQLAQIDGITTPPWVQMYGYSK